jgi:hypothetical protein
MLGVLVPIRHPCKVGNLPWSFPAYLNGRGVRSTANDDWQNSLQVWRSRSQVTLRPVGLKLGRDNVNKSSFGCIMSSLEAMSILIDK